MRNASLMTTLCIALLAPAAPAVASGPPDLDPPPIESRVEPDPEQILEWTPTSRLWRTERGTLAYEAFTAPLFFQDALGDWQVKDPSLVHDADAGTFGGATMPDDAVVFADQTAPGSIVVHIPGAHGAVEVTYPELVGTATPSVSEDGLELTYPAALSSNRDLVVGLTSGGYKESVVVHDPFAPSSYTTTFLVPESITVRPAAAGVEFVGSTGETVAVFGGGIAFDSALVPSTTDVSTVRVDQTARSVTVASSIDSGWLSDPARQFPVTIDPTYTTTITDDDSPNAGCANGPGEGDTFNHCDTYVRSRYPTQSVSYSSIDLRVGSEGADPLTDTNWAQRAFLMFPTDSRGLTPASRYHVLSSEIRLYAYAATSSTTDAVYLLDVTSSQPNRLTSWLTQPSQGPDHGGFDLAWATIEAPGDYAFDTTELAQEWFDGTRLNTGVRVTAANEVNVNHAKRFVAGNWLVYDYAPRLYIEYVDWPTVPSVAATAGDDGSVEVSWTGDAGGGTISYYVIEVVRDSDGSVMDYAYDSCSNGCGSWTFASQDVPHGESMHVRVRAKNETGLGASTVSNSVVPNAVPSVPTIASPADGSGASFTPAELTVVYDDPDGDAGKVWFELRDDGDGSLVGEGWSRSRSVASGEVAEFDAFPNPLPEGTYRWRSESYDELGGRSGWSGWWTFVIGEHLAGVAPPDVWSDTHPNEGAWYADPSATISMRSLPPVDPDDCYGCGIAGYSWVVDAVPTTEPDETIDTPHDAHWQDPETITETPGNGQWYAHVRAVNDVGMWSDTTHFGFRIDDEPPSPPALVTSASHPSTAGSAERDVDMTWLPGTDTHSGVAGYSWAFNDSEATGADGSIDGDDTTLAASWTAPGDGVYWFHVKTIDHAGNASDEVVYGPIFIDGDSDELPLTPTLGPEMLAQSDEMGLEQFFPLDRFDVGPGTGFVNLRTGNLVVQYQDGVIPAQGLNVAVTRTYNSQRDDFDRHNTGIGHGWSLSVTDVSAGLEGVVGTGSGLDLSAPMVNKRLLELVDDVWQATGQVMEFTDGDGTTHRFVRRGPVGSRWDSPPGVDLRLVQESDIAGLPTAYELIRPDGVVYRAEPLEFSGLPSPEWRVVSITDRNGNRLNFDYVELGGGEVRLVAVRHNRDGDTRLVELDWRGSDKLDYLTFSPGSGSDPFDGTARTWSRQLEFTLDDEGRLHDTRGARQFGFDWSGPRGTLTSVTDPRGNTTHFTYTDGRLTQLTDRSGDTWSYDYADPDTNGVRTTLKTAPPPSSAGWEYDTSPRSTQGTSIAGGNIVTIRDPGADDGTITASYAWDENRLVRAVDGAGEETLTDYDALGMVTRLTAPPPNDPGPLPPGAPTVPVETTMEWRYSDLLPYSGCAGLPDPSTVAANADCYATVDLIRVTAADNIGDHQRVTEYDYDDDGNLTELNQRARHDGAPDPDDRTVTFDHYTFGGLMSVDGPRTDVSDVTTYGDLSDPDYGGYHRSGQPTSITDAAGNTATFAYTPWGQLGAATDRDARVSRSRFDDLGRLDRLVDPAGDTTGFAYDANDNLTATTSPRGMSGEVGDFTTDVVYDAQDRPTQTRAPGGGGGPESVTTTVYNADGTVGSTIDPTGDTTTYSYWPNGALKRVTAPAGDGNQAVTDYRYDTAGRIDRVTHPGTATSTWSSRPVTTATYSPQGQVATRTRTFGDTGTATTTLVYDAHGAVIRTTGPRTVDGEDESVEAVHDAFGQTREIRRLNVDDIGARWLTSRFEYDDAGNVVQSRQPTGFGADLATHYTYDALNRVVRMTDPQNPDHEVRFAYTAAGLQTERWDWDLDADTAARTTSTVHNADATVRSVIAVDHRRNETLARCNWAEGGPPASGYDADGNLLHTRTLDGPCDTGTLIASDTLGYDHQGRLITASGGVRSPVTGQVVTRDQSLAPNADGTLASMTHDGDTTTFAYTPAGWVDEVTDWRGVVSSYAWTPSGRRHHIELGTAVTGETAFYRDGTVERLVWTRANGDVVRGHTGIGYDRGGYRTAESVSVVWPDGTTKAGDAVFDHDLAGRLRSWRSPFKASPLDDGAPVTTYRLDDAGNVYAEDIRVDDDLVSQTESSFVDNRLEERSTRTDYVAGASTRRVVVDPDYDPVGLEDVRTTTVFRGAGVGVPDPSTTLTTAHDAAGHVTELDDDASGAADVSFVYDASDRVVARTVTRPDGSQATSLYFHLATTGVVIEQTDDDGDTLVRYLLDAEGRTLGQRSYRVTPAGDRDLGDGNGTGVWLLSDVDGNVATLLRDDGTVLQQRAYSPYGRVDGAGTATSPDPTAPGSELGFQTAITDPDTGRVLLGPRQYDPELARFTTTDYFPGAGADLALGLDPLTGNRFLFAAANPVAWHDDGHRPCWDRGFTCGLPTAVNGGQAQRMIDRYGLHIARVATYFDLPPSLLAATIETEEVRDARSSLEHIGETVASGLCRLPLVNREARCRRLSTGLGQIQRRRADLVDDGVKGYYVHSVGGSAVAPFVERAWRGDPASILDRLGKAQANIVYIAAYLDLLRDRHGETSDWAAIYSQDLGVGSYNGSLGFTFQLQASRRQYGYLDDYRVA